MTPRLDGAEMPLDEAFSVRAGQVLKFDYLKAGARGYLAVAGGFAVPEVYYTRHRAEYADAVDNYRAALADALLTHLAAWVAGGAEADAIARAA